MFHNDLLYYLENMKSNFRYKNIYAVIEYNERIASVGDGISDRLCCLQ